MKMDNINVTEALENMMEDENMPPILDIPEMNSSLDVEAEDKKCYGMILNGSEMWLISETNGETAFGYKCTDEDSGYGYFNVIEVMQKDGSIPIPCFQAPVMKDFVPKIMALCQTIAQSKKCLDYAIRDTMTPAMIAEFDDRERKKKEWGIK